MLDGLAQPLERGEATLVRQGVLTARDGGDYLPFSFNVPAGVSGLHAVLRFVASGGNVLGLSVYHEDEFRGWGKLENSNGLAEITVELGVSPGLGCLPGPVHPGRWEAEISVAAVNGTCAYQLEIGLSQMPGLMRQLTGLPTRPGVISRRSGWYKGDLHVHSQDSDGQKRVEEIIGLAREKSLDFLALTDHNTTSGWWRVPADTGGVLPLWGMEITTFNGHANAWGLSSWVDWRVGRLGLDINAVMNQVHRQEALFSVNHPCTPGLPDGHACWRHRDLDWSRVDALEVWNAPVFSRGQEANRQCRRFWDELLNRGYRVTGLGGSDAHYLAGTSQPLGLPLTYVYGRELSPAGILAGIKAGRVFVTLGPKVFFQGANTSGQAMPGGELSANGGPVQLRAEVNLEGYPLLAKLIKKGRCVDQTRIGRAVQTIFFLDRPQVGDWYRLELVRASAGEELVAFTNPIYIR